MKLLITGDWHLDTYSPRNRTDDYAETQFDKIKWIYNLAVKKVCFVILQPGDLFNSHKANDFLKWRYINFMRAMTRPKDDIIQPPHLYTVFGQHDLRFHSSARENTPLSVLEAAEVCAICQEDPFIIGEDQYFDKSKHVYIYGCNWGEEIPPVREAEGVHILLIHKLILQDIEGWEQNYISAENMFRFCDHDIIVCGDNHQSFMLDKGDRLLFNCGSLMRSRVDQRDHEPCVYIVDTKDMSWTKHLIPVRPFEEVMNVDKAEQEKERNEQLEAFVSKLSGNINIEGLDFIRNLEAAMQGVDKSVKEFINEVMEE